MNITAAFQVAPTRMTSCRHISPRLMSSRNDEEGETRYELKHESRRSLLSKATAIAPLLTWASPAIAAPPMTLGESDGLGARAQRALRPKPPKLLRPKLNQDFAVLLMRSSYNALDKIDCIAMVRSCSATRVIVTT